MSRIKETEWFNQDCIDIIIKKNRIRQNMLQRETRQNAADIVETAKQKRKICRKKKLETRRQKVENIEVLNRNK